MFRFRFIATLAILLCATVSTAAQNATRTPSEVVRDFYKAMRDHRFHDAFVLTTYKPAVEGLTDSEMEDLRPGFEEKAAKVPATVEIVSEQINGASAIVFVRIPAAETTSPQVTSEPVNLIKSGADWIIAFGNAEDQAAVKQAGRRYFLDALIGGNEEGAEEFLKNSLFVLEGIYSQRHNGMYGDFPALITAGMLSNDAIDPKVSGYSFHITLSKDGKSYVAGAEPLRYGRTGKLSYWMDQTGVIKSANTGGKPLKP